MAHIDYASMATLFRNTRLNTVDSQWQGDEITGPKANDMTRLMFHNVNGIATQGPKGIDMFVNNQISLDVDIQGITEHCLDMTKYRVSQLLQEAVRKHAPNQYLLALHSSDEPAVHQYKPGGTGLLLLGNIVGRLNSTGIYGDSMGRWSAIHLRRQNRPPITVITAYQVCSRPTNILGNTAYHQQVRSLSRSNQNHLHPRQAFTRDLLEYIRTLQAQGNAIILGGDFNESLEDRNSGIHRIITAQHLVDPFLSKFPHTIPFGTHQNGSRRIDLVCVSPDILPTITKIGYAPYDFSVSSDHRACILEFDTKQLFGYGNPQLPPLQNRALKSKDKASVERFITAWFQQLSAHGVFSLITQIDNDSLEPSEVERLDTLIGTCGKQAEKACSRQRPEFYSQAIVQQRVKVSVLRGHLHALRKGIDRTIPLTAKMHRFGIEVPLSPSIQVTNAMLAQSVDTLRTVAKEHEERRQKELEEKIMAATARGNKTPAHILRSIKTTEMNQSTYRILRNIKSRSNSTVGIDRVEIPTSWPPPDTPLQDIPSLEDPKTCQQWRSVTSPSEVEYYLMLRNRLHFGQAEGTPFTRPPLVEDIDWGATTPAAEAVLTGRYPVTHSTPNCEDLLRACCQKQDVTVATSEELSLTEFRNKIRKWRESTTTSPSGRHLGWYKALFASGRPSLEPEQSDRSTLKDMQETITALILSITNYCLRHTYVLDRWKTIINVMIFKEQGNVKIHRLRIIHIYEADFNLLLAVKWRQLLRTADHGGWLNPGQYGGRPGCEAQSLTLLEELKYDLAYLTRRTLFNFDNDATSCYDRIVVPVASLINRKYGLHPKVAALHAQTLYSARYHLKTANGVSHAHYSTSPEYPIHGTGQGSGNSPCIWLLISSTLFDIHRTMSHGATFRSPDGSLQARMSMVGFVDDSTGTFNDFHPQHEAPLDTLLLGMQRDAQLWNNLLHCTGGRLELPKCSFHVVHFEFKPNGTPVPSIDSYDNRIHITDLETEESIPIPAKRVFEPHKTLGHYKSPSASQRSALDYLRRRADQAALLITISPITRRGAILAYHTVYIPIIRYTLPQSFFRETDLQQAQAASLHKLIPKCGYNRNTARALIFGPKNLGGCGFLPWYLLQGEGQILQFLKHWRTSTIVSDTLRVALSWAQWQSGHYRPILEDVHSNLTYLECRWLKSLRDFLSRINGFISVDLNIALPKERRGDFHIMQFAVTCGMFNSQELKILNYCRLYLHVTTVSELFEADGLTIIPALFYCQRESWFNKSTITTLQRRPSEVQIRRLWQKLCRQWTTSAGQLGLSYSLGSWLKPGHQLRRWRQTYILDESTLAYHWQDNCYWEYERVSKTAAQYRKRSPSQWTPTSKCIPVKVTHYARDSITIATPPKLLGSPKTPAAARTSSTFSSYVGHCATWVQYLIAGADLRFPPYEMITRLKQIQVPHSVLAVSDGSVKEGRLSYGWVLGSSDGTIFASHSGSGDGPPTSHRAEAWGMLSVVTFVHQLYQFTGEAMAPKSQPIEFFSDNNGLVTRVKQRLEYSKSYPNSTLLPDWDLIEQIHDTMIQIPHSDKAVSWVQGHQDETDQELTTQAQYNIQADALAASVHSSKFQNLHAGIRLPSAKCYLFVDNTMVPGNYTTTIRDAYLLPPYQQYVGERHRWSLKARDHVDWGLLQRAISRSQLSSIQIVKFLHDKLPTQAELSKYSPHISGQCHYCDSTETFTHLLQCDNPLSQSFRSALRSDVVEFLEAKNFPVQFQTDFLQSLDWSLMHTPPTITPEPCTQEQLSLGPRAFLKGLFHKSWHTILISQLTRDSSQTKLSADDLLVGLVHKLWISQLQFWTSHTHSIHSSDPAFDCQINHKLEQYQKQIRHLYTLKDQCLHVHRDQYFPQDVDDYLERSSLTQLKQYLHHYEPAIHQSIKQASTQAQRRITTFPGFIRNAGQALRSFITRPPPSDTTPSRPLGEQGTPTHHRHTRWRILTSSTSLKSFFPPRSKPA